MLTLEQKKIRKTGIGGSDVASIVGLSPWKTARELYYEKIGGIEDDNSLDDNELIHFGNVLEQVVADEYTRRHGEKLQKRNELIRHKEYPFMIANIDRKIVGRQAVFEAKTADKFTRGKWGEDGSDDIPDHYRTQVEHYMNVTGYDEAVLAVLIGGNEFRHYPIKKDKELSEKLIQACIQFWDMVEKRIEPPIDYEHKSTSAMLKRIYPGTNGETIILPESIAHWHQTKSDAEAKVKLYQSAVDCCKNHIADAIKGNAIGQLPDIGYEYTRAETKRKEFITQASTYMVMRGRKMKVTK